MALAYATFSEIITFTRASTATYVNSSGYVQTAATNEPRFDYDPVTLAPLGFLIEEARTNMVLYSAEFDNAAWTKSASTVTANATTSPDITLSAGKIVENTATAGHYVLQNPSFTSGTMYTASMYAQAAERTFVQIVLTSGAFGANVVAVFDLTAVTATGAGGTNRTQSITPAGGGWYRCVVSVQATATASANMQIRLSDSATTSPASYTGDGSSGAYIWGAQVTSGDSPTSYIPTSGTTVTRAVDVATVNTLSPWYNPAESTVFAQFKAVNATSTIRQQGIWSLDDISTLNVMYGARTSNSNRFRSSSRTGGVVDLDNSITSPVIADGAVAKTAFVIATDDSNKALNGTLGTPDTSVTVPPVSRMRLGSNPFANNDLNGHLQRILYYPRRLTNTEIQALTT